MTAMLNRAMTRRGFSGGVFCTSAAPCHAALIAMPAPVRSPTESCPGFFRTVFICERSNWLLPAR
jgi:hypothetical protein